MNKLIIVDFDRTLFDTGGLVKEMAEIFKVNGGIDFHETMRTDDKGNYSLNKHFEAVRPKARRKKVKKHIQNLLDRSHEFLFNDSIAFLQKFSSYSLVLLTKGEMGYQSRKVLSALKDWRYLFKQILITDGEKSRCVQDLIRRLAPQPQEIFVIDDKVKELGPIKKATPEVKTILISREGPVVTNAWSDFAVRNLVEAAEVILGGG